MKKFKISIALTGRVIITKGEDYTEKGLVKILKENNICDRDIDEILHGLLIKDTVIF